MESEQKIFHDWLEQMDQLGENSKGKISQWLDRYGTDRDRLYELWNRLPSDEEEFTEEGITLPVSVWGCIISGACNIFEEILPLGSVVDLKKEILERQLKEISKVEKVRIVITNRFLNYTSHGYFTYAGVVYPIGMLHANEVIHFAPSMIQEVVSKGYADDMERAYTLFMKRELIVNQKIRSYEFASEAESKELLKYMERKDGRGNQDSL